MITLSETNDMHEWIQGYKSDIALYSQVLTFQKPNTKKLIMSMISLNSNSAMCEKAHLSHLDMHTSSKAFFCKQIIKKHYCNGV